MKIYQRKSRFNLRLIKMPLFRKSPQPAIRVIAKPNGICSPQEVSSNHKGDARHIGYSKGLNENLFIAIFNLHYFCDVK